ncbi:MULTISPECIES: metallophosphoesterase family protein [unclassified Corynebacterium]|uniref:metallophosphoesterase family protein n=1 Tax=unclassified Corynebacterium TaxID=2624378 RepID=UPI003099A3C9
MTATDDTSHQNQLQVFGQRRVGRRTALLGGLGLLGYVGLGGMSSMRAHAAPSSIPSDPSVGQQVPFPFTGLKHGLVVTDLEVVTVTATSVVLCWATYDGPHPAWGTVAPLAPADTEVAFGPVGLPASDLPVVHKDNEPRNFHIVTVDGLEPETTYRFECRSGGVVARPGLITTNAPQSPEQTGTVTTLPAPVGQHLGTVVLLNDTHIGEGRHGIIVNNFPPPIEQEAGRAPYPELMLASALQEIKSRGLGPVFVNGDATSEARPHEVRKFIEIMNSVGEWGHDWFVTRGNHDRPHTPEADPQAGYEEFPVLEGTENHRDPFGSLLVKRQEHWVTQVGEIRVIGIDSTKLDESGGEISAEQLDAVEAELMADPLRPTFIMAHHPVSEEAAFSNVAGPSFTLNLHDSARLQRAIAQAPGVFLVAAGHTHRAKRTSGRVASDVTFVETPAAKAYPGGYTLVHVYSGGYQVNFHRIMNEQALEWASRARWAVWGLEPEPLLGTVQDRNFSVQRRIS